MYRVVVGLVPAIQADASRLSRNKGTGSCTVDQQTHCIKKPGGKQHQEQQQMLLSATLQYWTIQITFLPGNYRSLRDSPPRQYCVGSGLSQVLRVHHCMPQPVTPMPDFWMSNNVFYRNRNREVKVNLIRGSVMQSKSTCSGKPG